MRKTLVASLLLLSGDASPAEFTGLALRDLCTNTARESQLACDMWISGFEAGVFSVQLTAKSNLICIPDGVSGDQARLILEKFMREHPEVLHNKASVTSIVALTLAFPCRAKNSN